MQKRIGEFLLERGLITAEQLRNILSYTEKTGLRMGDAAVHLGIVSRQQMTELFGPDNSIDFFHLDPSFFPQSTRQLLTLDSILRLGALPLGTKTEYRMFKPRQFLNVGLLNPSRPGAIPAVESAIQASGGSVETQGIKVFLILAEQFVEVLREVYGVDKAQIRDRPPGEVDPHLSAFLKE